MTVDTFCGVQRIDKWLWFARLFKTRSLATRFVNSGKIRITRGKDVIRVMKASQNVQAGDVLTIPINRTVRILEIRDTGARRGPAPEAQLLYADLTPAPAAAEGTNAASAAKSAAAPARASGTGRPTKKERRSLDQWRETMG